MHICLLYIDIDIDIGIDKDIDIDMDMDIDIDIDIDTDIDIDIDTQHASGHLITHSSFSIPTMNSSFVYTHDVAALSFHESTSIIISEGSTPISPQNRTIPFTRIALASSYVYQCTCERV